MGRLPYNIHLFFLLLLYAVYSTLHVIHNTSCSPTPCSTTPCSTPAQHKTTTQHSISTTTSSSCHDINTDIMLVHRVATTSYGVHHVVHILYYILYDTSCSTPIHYTNTERHAVTSTTTSSSSPTTRRHRGEDIVGGWTCWVTGYVVSCTLYIIYYIITIYV